MLSKFVLYPLLPGVSPFFSFFFFYFLFLFFFLFFLLFSFAPFFKHTSISSITLSSSGAGAAFVENGLAFLGTRRAVMTNLFVECRDGKKRRIRHAVFAREHHIEVAVSGRCQFTKFKKEERRQRRQRKRKRNTKTKKRRRKINKKKKNEKNEKMKMKK